MALRIPNCNLVRLSKLISHLNGVFKVGDKLAFEERSPCERGVAS